MSLSFFSADVVVGYTTTKTFKKSIDKLICLWYNIGVRNKKRGI